MHGFLFRFFFLFILSSSNLVAQQNPAFPKGNTGTVLTHTIIESVDHTFGYDIYNAGKLMIHQPSVPGVAGNKGFKTKADARKVATLVISKIKKGEMPPTLTTEDLKRLNITL